MSDTHPLPPDLAARARDYFRAVMPAPAVETAMAELASDVAYWGDDRPVDVFSAARTILHSRVRIADDLEAVLLHEDGNLTVDEVAKVMRRGPAEVRELLDAAALELEAPLPPVTPPAPRPSVPAETTSDGAPDRDRTTATTTVAPDVVTVAGRDADEATAATSLDDLLPPSSGPSRRTVLWLALGAVVLVILAVAFRPDGATPCPDGAEVCVVESVMTSEVDDAEAPLDRRELFTVEDDVLLWFRFERRDSLDEPQVTLRWYRDEAPLYSSTFLLPPTDTAAIELAKLQTQPGDYRVEVVSGDQVIAEERFRVAAAGAA